MTAKEKIEAQERKYHMYCLSGHKCQVCGKWIKYDQAQIAHRIIQSKQNIKKYGKEIIHHPKNMVVVCSLACNSAVIISTSTQPIKAAELIREIEKEVCREK